MGREEVIKFLESSTPLKFSGTELRSHLGIGISIFKVLEGLRKEERIKCECGALLVYTYGVCGACKKEIPLKQGFNFAHRTAKKRRESCDVYWWEK